MYDLKLCSYSLLYGSNTEAREHFFKVYVCVCGGSGGGGANPGRSLFHDTLHIGLTEF